MAISTKHAFVSAKADGTDSTVVQPSDWNADHTITLAAGKVIGRVSGTNGAAQELPLAFDPSLQSMIPPAGTTAQRPATPVDGMMRYNSTTAQLEMYRNSTWGAVGGNAFVGAAAPPNPQDGDFWYNSTTGQIQIYVAGGWKLSMTNLLANTFAGNGAQTVFVLSVDPGTKQNTSVFISGVYQEKSTYSISGTSLTFTAAPPAGTVVEVMLMASTTIGVPNNGSVTTAKLADGAVATAKIADGAVTLAKLGADAVTPPTLQTSGTADGSWAGGVQLRNNGTGVNTGVAVDANLRGVIVGGLQVNESASFGSYVRLTANTEAGALADRRFSGLQINPDGSHYTPIVGNVGFQMPSYTCRAFINFQGNPAILRIGANVAFVRNGVGDYTVIFSVAMPDANYVICGGISQSGQGSATETFNIVVKSAASFQIVTKYSNPAIGANFDPTWVELAVFR